ncbi:hypothetical protein Tco_0881509 [Tanacetum coccineum]
MYMVLGIRFIWRGLHQIHWLGKKWYNFPYRRSYGDARKRPSCNGFGIDCVSDSCSQQECSVSCALDIGSVGSNRVRVEGVTTQIQSSSSASHINLQSPTLLTDEEIIESVIGINKDDIDEEDDESSTMEPPSRNEAIKAAITLNNFLLSYEKTTPEVLTMLRKIRDEIQGEIDFNKKQKTIESFFKKPS